MNKESSIAVNKTDKTQLSSLHRGTFGSICIMNCNDYRRQKPKDVDEGKERKKAREVKFLFWFPGLMLKKKT